MLVQEGMDFKVTTFETVNLSSIPGTGIVKQKNNLKLYVHFPGGN